MSSKEKDKHFNTIIAGSQNEYDQTLQLLKEAGLDKKVLGRIVIDDKDDRSIGHWKDIRRLSTIVPFREMIFCEGTLSFKNIIETMQDLPGKTVVKIHAAGSYSIVGSQSKDESGEAVSKENGFNLSNPYNRRLKRLIDVSISLIGLLSFPIQLLLVKKPFRFLGNCFAVLFASKTWIGYAVTEKKLPSLRKPVFACNGIRFDAPQQLPVESLQMMDYWYARDYEPVNDLKLAWKVYRYHCLSLS